MLNSILNTEKKEELEPMNRDKQRKIKVEHLSKILPDGVELKITRELKVPSARCCLCGVKLILDELNSMMCLKCSNTQDNKEEVKTPLSSTGKEDVLTSLEIPTENSNYFPSSTDDKWSKLDNSPL